MKPVLTPTQLERLKDHKYRSEGGSLIEYYVLQYFWEWLVRRVPLWVAPNLITFVGFCISVVCTVLTVCADQNGQGLAPRWCYLMCAICIFIYQTLDGIDGKQARRTGTSSPLGEFFDHGCDAIITFLYALVCISTVGLNDNPLLMLCLVVVLIQLNYSYHWQTYVSGILHFKSIDIGEAHYAQIISLLVTFFFGIETWSYVLPGMGLSLKFMMCTGTLVVSVTNLFHAYYIILTKGVGKNGSTVADTSVVSPIITSVVLVGVAFCYALDSPSRLLHSHAMMFMTAFCFPMSKMVIHMMVSGMTKSPFPLLDYIMLGPLLAYLNVYLGTPLPEIYVITAVAVYNIFDISSMCISICQQMCEALNVTCFTIPHTPKKD